MPKTPTPEKVMFIETVVGMVGLVGMVVTISKTIHDKSESQKLLAQKAAEEEKRKDLFKDISVTVFIRESNHSRTEIEHHVEREFLSRGARVVIANQETGMSLVKRGEYAALNPEAHLTLVGTLVVKDGPIVPTKVFTEPEHDFNIRKAEHRHEVHAWETSWDDYPKPQLEPRRHLVEMVSSSFLYQFSYRVLGRDGAVLASGAEEALPSKDKSSFDTELRDLAKRAVESLEQRDLWSDIVV